MENWLMALTVIALVLLSMVYHLRGQVRALRKQLDDLDEDVTRWMTRGEPA